MSCGSFSATTKIDRVPAASRGIRTRDDLADLAVDELTEITAQSADEAKTLIMKAREHWFTSATAASATTSSRQARSSTVRVVEHCHHPGRSRGQDRQTGAGWSAPGTAPRGHGPAPRSPARACA